MPLNATTESSPSSAPTLKGTQAPRRSTLTRSRSTLVKQNNRSRSTMGLPGGLRGVLRLPHKNVNIKELPSTKVYSPLKTIQRIWELTSGLRWRLIVALIGTILYVVAKVAAPAYSAIVVDAIWQSVQSAKSAGEALTVTFDNCGTQIFIYLLIMLASWLFYALKDMVLASFAERFVLSLRKKISLKLERLSFGYYDTHTAGEIMSVATNDLDIIASALQSSVADFIVSTANLIGAVILTAVINVQLALFFVACIVFSTIITGLISSFARKQATKRQKIFATFTSKVEEAYSGRSVIKAFACEDTSYDDIYNESLKLAKVSEHVDFLTNTSGTVIRLINRMMLVFAAFFAGNMLMARELSIGQFQAAFQYVQSGSSLFRHITDAVIKIQTAIAAAQHVFEFLDAPEAETPGEGALAVPSTLLGKTDFDNVSFGYVPGKILMKDVSFNVAPGQKVAIVGTTGSGKSTIINLLMRFYETNSGTIKLDNLNMRKMEQRQFRSSFGMVPQDTWLFEGTIAENIAYGNLDATREDIISAAKAANIDFFIRSLPDGYDTVISGDDDLISQGQRQLLTIARAIINDPVVFILDEATSSVDTRTERSIVEATQQLMKGRTSFVVAHRLSTIIDADLILVMDNGDIVERGTHSELLAANGIYADIYRSQFA